MQSNTMVMENNLKLQRVLNDILSIALENTSLQELLDRTIEKIISAPFISPTPSGGIFLVEEEDGILNLKVKRGISEILDTVCTRVEFGKCSCGIAAATGKIQFVDCIQEIHKIVGNEMRSHGHYSVPIISREKILGVLIIYVEEGRERSSIEEEFLSAVANTIAGIIEHKRVEKELKSSREELRNLLDHMHNVREIERSRIAREIHDELGQSLSLLQIDLFWIENNLTEECSSILEKVTVMSKSIDDMVEVVQKIATELRPGLLDDLGLAAAIEWHANEFQNRTGIQCILNLGKLDFPVSRNISTAIFRIFQEALTNIMRHSEAKVVRINLNLVEEKLKLTVMDDGKGISRKQISDCKSIGIIGMRERIRFLNGKFEVRGAPGKGTTVTVTVPFIDN